MVLMPDEAHHASDRAEQLSLLSSEELEALRSPSSSRMPLAAGKTPSCQSDGDPKPRRPKRGAIQDKLQGF